MSTRDARFEVVRTDAGWHARFVAANGQTVWTTESYRRRTAAVRAIELIVGSAVYSPPHNEHAETPWRGNRVRPTEVRTIDERTPPPAPVVLEPPFYVTTTINGETFWHDRDYHFRHCYGDECTEGTPPAGEKVRGRLGWADHEGVTR